MFSGDPHIVMIEYCHYNIFPPIIYVSCEFDPKVFCSHYRKYEEKDGYNDLFLKIEGIVKCKRDPNTDRFTIILHK
jgi:hypothetical protein